MSTRCGELPPLENTLVLHHIFERCSVSDLKSCRLVSRLWRDASKTAWKSSAVARINSNEFLEGRMSDFQLFSRDYDRDQEQIQETPFTRFHLQTENSVWFFSNWGSSVKSLKLAYVTFESGKDFANAIFNYCVNLEKLALIGVTVAAAPKLVKEVDWDTVQGNKKMKSLTICEGLKWEGVVWMEILSRCPSLQAFTLVDPVSKCSELFESLRGIREHRPNSLNLKWIDIHRIFDASHCVAMLPVLLDSRLQLESLKLRNSQLPDVSNSLSKIIENNASSLRKLVIQHVLDAVIDRYIVHFRSPSQKQLQNLQVLHISYLSQGQVDPLVYFLELAPNLRKLIFWSWSAKDLGIDVPDVQDIKLKYCSELELLGSDVTTQQLKHLIIWMPNLKKLTIQGLSNEAFSMVCDGWSNLECLDVIYSKIGDAGITGLDDIDVATINANGETGVWRPVTVLRANITCLKDLRKLKLSGTLFLRRYNAELGYCAVKYGLGLLPNLKYLNLEDLNLTPPSEAFLRNVCAQNPWPEDELDED